MYRKILSIFAVMLAVFALFSCAKTGGNENINEEIAEPETSTLLVYMVGSDLEGRAAAATTDLQEMETSGIDLTYTNVVVCAGGSQYWHNDSAAIDKVSLLELSEDGFSQVGSMPLVSMGEANTLLEFLNYGYDSYPSDNYALIMWDHGNGPVIGYGKDMLFDGDTLTLAEMKEALEASHFCGEEKFEFVGFDACLMASAELACTWQEHAKYLIASQEIEPAPGWNYAFLKDFGKCDSKELANSIIDTYMQSCYDYYDKKGFEDRDTTLSCVDLAYAGELESALERLFSKASVDVVEQYNVFAAKRVDTRSLGRASTGSEYDLVDIGDMADKLYDVYPEEVAKIKEALEKLVVTNGSNTEGCCGLSFYYPFYNKYYYQSSWSEAYSNLDLFDSYAQYLDNYQSVWLLSDKLESFAASIMPSTKEPHKYSLKLTEEQVASLADVKYYVLESSGGDLYHSVFSSHNITNEDGLLIANFDGNVIYAKDGYGSRVVPVVKEYDTVGDVTRYSISSSSLKGKEKDAKHELAFFQLALNNKTGKVGISAILPSLDSVDKYYLMGGKNEELTLGDYAEVCIYHFFYSYLTRYENGTVKPLDEWTENPMASGWEFTVADGFEFALEPLSGGEYYLVFEMTDTQGNKYCSELLPITAPETEEENYRPEDINVVWSAGDRVDLVNTEGVCVYLEKAEKYNDPIFVIGVENDSEYPVSVTVDDIIFNGNVLKGYGANAAVDAKSVYDGGLLGYFTFEKEVRANAFDEIYSISCTVNISSKTWTENQPAFKTFMHEQGVNVEILEEARYKDLGSVFGGGEYEAYFGAKAQAQVLCENEKIRVSITGFGAGDTLHNGYICVENLSDETFAFNCRYYAVNGITMLCGNAETVFGGCKVYMPFEVSEYRLEQNGISEIESIELCVVMWENGKGYLDGEPLDILWLPVTLSQSGNAEDYKVYGKELFNEGGVRIMLLGEGERYSKKCWKIAIINDGDETVSIDSVDKDGNDSAILISDDVLGPHQYVETDMYTVTGYEGDEVSFAFEVLNFARTKILATDGKVITMKVIK